MANQNKARQKPGWPGFGQIPGEHAPNFGKKYAAELLTPEEVAALIDQRSKRYASGIRDRALLTLLYRSGLRAGEVLAIRPSDVNFDRHSIRLRATKSQEAQTAGFHPGADLPLVKWIETRKARGLDVNGNTLFCTLTGGPMSYDAARLMIIRCGKKAGIEKRVHLHGLRHTFAAELEYAGEPIEVIQRLLRHKSVGTTAIYLRHLTNGAAIAALEAAELPALPGDPDYRAAATTEQQLADLQRQVAELSAQLGRPGVSGRRGRATGRRVS